MRLPPIALAAIVLAVAPLLSPSPAAAFTTAVSDIEWRVVEIEGKPVDDAGVLVFFRNQMGGRAACNRVFGQFGPTAEGGHAFQGIGVSRMHCEGRMELEQALLKALERMQSHKLDGRTLLLLDAHGKTLVKLYQ